MEQIPHFESIAKLAARFKRFVAFAALAKLASRFKGFVAFAAFLILCAIVLFVWLFSAGSFDSLIINFNILSREQFFWLVMVVLLLTFPPSLH